MNFPHHYKITKEKCVVRIDDKEYDVSAWRKYHPGGAEILDLYHLRDATEAFYAFHSKEAINLLTHTPKNQTDLKPEKNDNQLV
jgi:cytochrome b involved in lipid metabolism